MANLISIIVVVLIVFLAVGNILAKPLQQAGGVVIPPPMPYPEYDIIDIDVDDYSISRFYLPVVANPL